MELFVKMWFCSAVFGYATGVLTMALNTYPRKVEYSAGFDAAVLFISTPIILWAGYLLWFQ